MAPALGENPFTPDFGQHPPLFAGRDDAVNKMTRVLAAGPKNNAFTSLMLGPRGIGKTTMLLTIMDYAEAAGWRTIQIDAPLSPEPGEGAVADITERVHEHLDAANPPPKRRLTSFKVPIVGGGAGWDRTTERQPSYRKLLEQLVDATSDSGGAGVLLALDEFHNLTAPEASRIAGALQQITKIGKKNLAFLGVGLPHIEYTLLTNNGFTFFHRCNRERVGHIELHAAMRAVEGPLGEGGITIGNSDLKRAALATSGLGYAIQSIGYHLWNLAPTSGKLTAEHVTQAIDLMDDDVARHVTAPTWHHLSAGDKRFLFAMLPDDGPSRLKDIRARLASEGINASEYKSRLLSAGVIVETPLGDLKFASAAIKARAVKECDYEVAEREEAAAARSRPHALRSGFQVVRPIIPASEPAAPPPVCAAEMPRLPPGTTCVLPSGHSGGHRSKKPPRNREINQ